MSCSVEDVIARHSVLRTALYLNTNGTIVQHCLDASAVNNDVTTYGFSAIDPRENDDDRKIQRSNQCNHQAR